MDLLKKCRARFKDTKTKTMTMAEYIKGLPKHPEWHATAAERMLAAIGEPKLIDTSKNGRLGRVHANRVIAEYEVFKDFFGMNEVVQQIVSFFRHAAQGLEESRQILYLLGPVGSAKSSLAERLKKLMESQPITVLSIRDENDKVVMSPIQESPLGLFSADMAESLGVPKRKLKERLSPWALKRLEEFDGDISKFFVTVTYPSQDKQIAISKTEPGDENNQDISTLVGKLDIRKLEFHSQNDTDAYNYSGGLCHGNQGILEFVEMFKAPIKVLHPLLTATQEGNYKGTESIGAIPFDGIILAHSNESEWEQFKKNKNNEAFLDRIYIVEAKYCLQINEEKNIYRKLLENSDLKDAPIAPGTLEMLAKFCVASRLDIPENSSVVLKMKAYNGDDVKQESVNAKSVQEYREGASAAEGFYGISTRLAYKILAEVFNFEPNEVAADPIHLLYVLEKVVKRERYSEEYEARLMTTIKEYLEPSYFKLVGKHIQMAYLEAYADYGQALFDRYIQFADYWIQDADFRDPDTGQIFDRKLLNKELEKIEKAAGISNPKDFRHEMVTFCLRYRANNKGSNPKWTTYEPLKKVIEANLFSRTEDLLPIISFSGHGSSQDKEKHEAFVDRMCKLGYTNTQVRRIVEAHMRYTH